MWLLSMVVMFNLLELSYVNFFDFCFGCVWCFYDGCDVVGWLCWYLVGWFC